MFTAPDTVDHRVDLYGLGLVFHALVTQTKPYPKRKSESDAELLQRVIHESLPRPSGVKPGLPPELDILIAKATHKDPSKRFQSGEEFADAVEFFAQNQGGLATAQEVRRWYQTHFAERIESRRSFVHKTMERAKQSMQSDQLTGGETERDSVTPSLMLDVPVTQPALPDFCGDEENFTSKYNSTSLRRLWRSPYARVS